MDGRSKRRSHDLGEPDWAELYQRIKTFLEDVLPANVDGTGNPPFFLAVTQQQLGGDRAVSPVGFVTNISVGDRRNEPMAQCVHRLADMICPGGADAGSVTCKPAPVVH